jgi:hypothetical protein
MSIINSVMAAISKFRESKDRDPALTEVLTQILEALKEIEGRFEALEASAMEWAEKDELPLQPAPSSSKQRSQHSDRFLNRELN